MSKPLPDTQLVLLSAASQREDQGITLPTGARLGPARKAAGKLLEAGLVREIRARKNMPVWRSDDETGQVFALKVTAAGLKAIAAGESEEDEKGSGHTDGASLAVGPEARGLPTTAPGEAQSSPVVVAAVLPLPNAPRAGSKISSVIAALEKGATIDELIAATGWLPHTTRAALTGLRKRGYAIVADRSDRTRGTIYRIGVAGPTEGASSTGARAPAAEYGAEEVGGVSSSNPGRDAPKLGPRPHVKRTRGAA